MTETPIDYMWQDEEDNDASTQIFESRSERIQRKLSLFTINVVAFIHMLGFSIVLTGAYPYLLQIDENADKVILGWIIAANPVGQLIASPIVGWLGTRWKSVRWLCMGTGVLNMLGFITYACLELLPQPRRYWMMGARFIVGVAAGSVTLCITYISKATTTKERTSYISINALAATIGFILGPVIQSSLVPLGQDGVQVGIGDFHFNLSMYTAAGWLAASLALVSVILFSPCIFREFDMAEKEARWIAMKHVQKPKTHPPEPNNPQAMDLIGVILCIINFSVSGFILIMIESLATPIVMDQLGLTDEEAVKKVGIVLSAGCVLTAIAFALSGPLAKKFTERRVLLLLGLLPMIISHVIVLPYSGPTPLMQEDFVDEYFDNRTETFNATALTLGGRSHLLRPNSTSHRGCPVVQEWCLTTPALHAEQLITGFMFAATGFAFTNAMSTSTLTQVLGSSQQGIWTGIYQAGGSLSRILSPLYLTNVYTNYGTWATFGSLVAVLLLVISINCYFSAHLIPLSQRQTVNNSKKFRF